VVAKAGAHPISASCLDVISLFFNSKLEKIRFDSISEDCTSPHFSAQNSICYKAGVSRLTGVAEKVARQWVLKIWKSQETPGAETQSALSAGGVFDPKYSTSMIKGLSALERTMVSGNSGSALKLLFPRLIADNLADTARSAKVKLVLIEEIQKKILSAVSTLAMWEKLVKPVKEVLQ
jgi:hypothetical protein